MYTFTRCEDKELHRIEGNGKICKCRVEYVQEKSTAYILNSEDKGTVRKIKYDVPRFHKRKDAFRKKKVLRVQFQDSSSKYRQSAINIA